MEAENVFRRRHNQRHNLKVAASPLIQLKKKKLKVAPNPVVLGLDHTDFEIAVESEILKTTTV